MRNIIVSDNGNLDELPSGNIGDHIVMGEHGPVWAGGNAVTVVSSNPAFHVDKNNRLTIDLDAPGSFDGERSIMAAIIEAVERSNVGYAVDEVTGDVTFVDHTGKRTVISRGPIAVLSQGRKATGKFDKPQKIMFYNYRVKASNWESEKGCLLAPAEGVYVIGVVAHIEKSEGSDGAPVLIHLINNDRSRLMKRVLVDLFTVDQPVTVEAETMLELSKGESIGVKMEVEDAKPFVMTVELHARRL